MTEFTAQGKAKELLLKLRLKARYEAHLKDLNKNIGIEIGQLHDAMVDEGLDSIEIDGIKFAPQEETTFALNKDVTDAGKWDDCPEFLAWLEETKNSGVIKTIKTVHPQTRTKLIKEHVEKGGELPPFIKENVWGSVKYNKSAVARLVESDRA